MGLTEKGMLDRWAEMGFVSPEDSKNSVRRNAITSRVNVYELCQRAYNPFSTVFTETVLSKEAVDAIIDCAVSEAVEVIMAMLHDDKIGREDVV